MRMAWNEAKSSMTQQSRAISTELVIGARKAALPETSQITYLSQLPELEKLGGPLPSKSPQTLRLMMGYAPGGISPQQLPCRPEIDCPIERRTG